MNIYRVSTGCYSDTEDCILLHDEKFSDDSFKNVCTSVLLSLSRKDDYTANLEDMVEGLINAHGFKRAKFLQCHFWDYSYKPQTKTVQEDLFVIRRQND
jgi:hypothetical protein